MLRIIPETKEIQINRGDRGTIRLIAKNGQFNAGDQIKFSIVDYHNYNNVVFQKTYDIIEDGIYAYITLTKEDTTIGDVISQKKQYWYEIEYDGDLTIVGYDYNSAKKFTLYPEAPQKRSEVDE